MAVRRLCYRIAVQHVDSRWSVAVINLKRLWMSMATTGVMGDDAKKSMEKFAADFERTAKAYPNRTLAQPPFPVWP